MARRKIKTLLDLIDEFAPVIRDALLEALQGLRDDVDKSVAAEMVRRLEMGDITGAVDLLGIEPAAFRPVQIAIEQAFETGGVFIASQVPRLVNGAVFRFDVRNSRAEEWLRDYSSTAIQDITTEQIDIVRNELLNGLAEGVNPKALVPRIVGSYDPIAEKRTGGVLGLNKPQAKWLTDARTELESLDPNYLTRELRDKRFDSVFKKAIDNNTPLTQSQIDKLGNRYEDGLLRYRAETIGRNESLIALNKSANEGVQQLMDSGTVTPSDVKRIWDATHDNRTRQAHQDADGQSVGPDEDFTLTDTDGRTYKLRFPGDSSRGAPLKLTILCRCHVRLEIDFIGAYKRGKKS